MRVFCARRRGPGSGRGHGRRPVVAAARRIVALSIEVGALETSAAREITCARTPCMRAARLIQTGQVFELGHVLSPTMPFFPGRRFDLLTKRTIVNPGLNHRGSNEEIVFTELGQVGTQFDGFSHQTIGDRLYNCFSLAEISSRTGFSKLGIEHVGALMTRGVLIDVAALKGAEMLPDGYEITAEDLQQALQREKLTLQPGDAVIINTGWGRLWEVDNARYAKGRPGSAWAPPEWLVRQDPMLVGVRQHGASKSTRTPTPSCRCPFIRSCWSSTGSTSSRR